MNGAQPASVTLHPPLTGCAPTRMNTTPGIHEPPGGRAANSKRHRAGAKDHANLPRGANRRFLGHHRLPVACRRGADACHRNQRPGEPRHAFAVRPNAAAAPSPTTGSDFRAAGGAVMGRRTSVTAA